MRNQFEAFIDDLRSTHGSNLVSVILYGSAAAGDFMPGHSDYNLLVALKRITPQDLRNAQPAIREWAKMGHPVPAYFTVSELQNAADVFPIEFMQMEMARKVIFGRDVLAGLTITDEYLRHQSEFELRSKLMHLRRRYIPVASSAEGLARLMAKSIAGFAAVFRAVLFLSGVEPPATKREVVALAADQFGIDFVPFEKIFNIRTDNFAVELTEPAANELFAQYMLQIEKVIEIVDAMKQE